MLGIWLHHEWLWSWLMTISNRSKLLMRMQSSTVFRVHAMKGCIVGVCVAMAVQQVWRMQDRWRHLTKQLDFWAWLPRVQIQQEKVASNYHYLIVVATVTRKDLPIYLLFSPGGFHDRQLMAIDVSPKSSKSMVETNKQMVISYRCPAWGKGKSKVTRPPECLWHADQGCNLERVLEE